MDLRKLSFSIFYFGFFFFKQKTAYEVRISDWSSDVCSSDLTDPLGSVDLVRRYGDQVRAIGDRDAPEALHRVAQQQAVLRMGSGNEIGDRLDRPDLVVDEHRRDDPALGDQRVVGRQREPGAIEDRKSTRLNSSH